jgi:monovalent cation/hydrogen antiporter
VLSFEILLALLIATVLAAWLARRLEIPLPIMLVMGGLAIALIPGIPTVQVPPELAFAIFVPPLLFRAAITTSTGEWRSNRRALLLLAVGLVGFTTVAVAGVAHWSRIGMTWGPAFVLGAILSPPDAVIGIGLARAVGVPRRVAALVEGEALLNDAAAFVLFGEAVAATSVGSFSIALAIPRLLYVAAGGVLIGFAVHLLINRFRAMLRDPVLENVGWLLTPFAAFLPAERLGVSGVLAVVTAGILLRHSSSLQVSAQTRVSATAVYDVVEFILNGLLFILIGMEVGAIVSRSGGVAAAHLVAPSLIIAATVMVARIVWVFPGAYLPRMLSRRIREQEPKPPLAGVGLLSWMGVRGGDSLVTALAVPITLANGAAFQGRDLVIGIAFGVIVCTLLVQGLTLAPLARALRLAPDRASEEEEHHARGVMHDAALTRLAEIKNSARVPAVVLDEVRVQHEQWYRRREEPGLYASHRQVQYELLQARRKAAVALRDRHRIDDTVLRRLEQELDFEELRLSKSK